MMILFVVLLLFVVQVVWCGWRELSMSSSNERRPLGRDAHGLCGDPDTGNVFLFGGEEDVKDSEAHQTPTDNDVLWRFDSCNETWTPVSANQPTPISVTKAICNFDLDLS
jgi:hypothetical protein